VPGPDLLCAPCDADVDCRPAGVETADLCLGEASLGRFCGIDCSLGAGCPDGYECVTPAGRDGGVRQCVPAAGAECACPAVAIQSGLSTGCTVANDIGTCPGRRTCTQAGLSECDAPQAADETCNVVDDDCDGDTDEDIVFGTCALQWGRDICVGPRVCEDGTPTCKAGPPTTEVCNGWDDDCDGDTDEDGTKDCFDSYYDGDGDGTGTGEPRCACAFNPPWNARVGGDCDDGDADVLPGGVEACDGKDNDCDGHTDPPGLPDCVLAYIDADHDGFGDPATGSCLCDPEAVQRVRDGTDCDDGDDEVNPGRAEVCNGKDDNCDTLVDDGQLREGCQVYRADADQDGWGSVVDGPCLCHPDGEWVTTKGGDCDETTADRNPGMAETCNDIDDDCDDAVDEDFDCDPDTVAVEGCGFCGTRTRTCGQDCRWPEWSECAGSKTCEPGTLQPCVEGCGNRVCTEACEWPEACTFTKDAYEPNEFQAAAWNLGYYDEEDSPPDPLTGWIHGANDADWFGFLAEEEWPFFPPIDTDGTLIAAATLTVAEGYHELCILWDDGPDGIVDDTRCTQGSGTLYVETPDVDPGTLDEAYGRVYVSVKGDPSCTPYTLSFYWD